MTIDLRTGTIESYYPENGRRGKVIVTVDGVEINQVWFIDLYRGVVKTYDVLGEGKPYAALEITELPPDMEMLGAGGVLSRTITGKVKVVMTSPDETGENPGTGSQLAGK